MFATYFPALFEEYAETLHSVHEDNLLLHLLFDSGIWPALSVNFPPNAYCHVHTNTGNKANGMCPVFLLGDFNATKGSHLWLSNLKLIIEFPPSCLIFIPFTSLCYRNIPVTKNEVRTS